MQEVPLYKVLFSEPEKNDYAVVIPVINEGTRIISLLNRMKELDIGSRFDIVIVDGGSTDGSLTDLKSLSVNSLLLKVEEGKLSSQLRCAYDFCLKRNYRGVITIDGNDKDAPSAIDGFASKLGEGYDFVQASRFIPGGKEINTPFSRKFAIKYIHSPILSFFSGFRWTDTTQGFRAYSRQLLEDKKIGVFRSIFKKYELLPYLNYIAPRLGFKCVEYPTSRIYPAGKVPTKISFLRGNFEVLVVLFKTILGFYNNKKE